ncbi:MAG: molybdopterin-dependent oxidoreductase [Haloarculaceae archaeon]
MAPGALSRLAPPPRVVDWSIFAAVGFELASGLLSLTVGTPDGAWVFDLHAVVGFAIVALLGWKFRRVAARVRRPSRWDRATPVSLALAALAVAALATGGYWALSGPVRIAGWPLLFVHAVLGVLVAPVLLWHLRNRFRAPAAREFRDRRTALRYGALLGAGAVTWRLQRAATERLSLPGADRRFTGTKPAEGTGGNDFPVTNWVADDPDPVDPAGWTLAVGGRVDRSLELSVGDLDPASSERALLDCTSGWYAERAWRGVRVGDLLATAGSTDDARWVRFRSVTGYRWSLPIEEAGDALLATHVDGEPLSHGHGAPIRLVAPGRRGFQWVKWVTAVEVTRRRDVGEWLAIFVSGLDG